MIAFWIMIGVILLAGLLWLVRLAVYYGLEYAASRRRQLSRPPEVALMLIAESRKLVNAPQFEGEDESEEVKLSREMFSKASGRILPSSKLDAAASSKRISARAPMSSKLSAAAWKPVRDRVAAARFAASLATTVPPKAATPNTSGGAFVVNVPKTSPHETLLHPDTEASTARRPSTAAADAPVRPHSGTPQLRTRPGATAPHATNRCGSPRPTRPPGKASKTVTFGGGKAGSAGASKGNDKVQALLGWCQAVVGVPPYDLELSSWRAFADGLAFCALLHVYFPRSIPYETLEAGEVEANCSLAFQVAEENGVIHLLDVEDMVALYPKPDKKSIILYVSFLHAELSLRQPAVQEDRGSAARAAGAALIGREELLSDQV